MGEPEFSQEARDAKVSGIVKLLARITDKGKVEDIWLLTPLGYGLDENAANAYRQEVFKPAQMDGKPVEVQLIEDLNFEIF